MHDLQYTDDCILVTDPMDIHTNTEWANYKQTRPKVPLFIFCHLVMVTLVSTLQRFIRQQFVSTLLVTNPTPPKKKKDFRPAVGYRIEVKLILWMRGRSQFCDTKGKATHVRTKRQTGHARQNCKKEYMNKTLVLNNSSDIAAWVPHECSQQLMLSFKSTREPNCWSTSENRRGTRGAERRSTEKKCWATI